MKKITVLEKLLSDAVFDSEDEARRWVMTGRVLADDRRIDSVFEKIDPGAEIRVKEAYKRKFVGKGSLKLSGALDTFGVSAEDRVCLDCGASTGGFTDCLLQRGASLVYAVDAGHGMLAEKLKQDARVKDLENTNLADNSLASLDPAPDLLTLDLSYLSLKAAYEHAYLILHGFGEIVALVKPIFETASAQVRRTGKINDPAVLREVLEDLLSFFSARCAVEGLCASPVRGNTGAVEFFLHLRLGAGEQNRISDPESAIFRAIGEALELPKFSKKEQL